MFPVLMVDSDLGLDLRETFEAARSEVKVHGLPIKQEALASLMQMTSADLSRVLSENRMPTRVLRLLRDEDGRRFLAGWVVQIAIAAGWDFSAALDTALLRAAVLAIVDGIQKRVPLRADTTRNEERRRA